MIKRIAITGPESTGKSMLAKQLAETYKTSWVPEYARDYIQNLHRNYHYDDILAIAKKQHDLMQHAGHNAYGYIFFDTELLVTKIWCEFKFGKCHPWILETLKKQQIDLYLLMDIDLPWQPDPQREHPDKRKILFDLYQQNLENLNFKYKIISGNGMERTQNAITAINEQFA